MTEFKFACPVCGQHISCDAAKAGSQMECPTCFQKLVVPEAPRDNGSKYIITASKVQTKRLPTVPALTEIGRPKKSFPFAAIALVLVLAGIAVAGYVFRDKILNRQSSQSDRAVPGSSGERPASASTPPSAYTSSDPHWTLDIEAMKIPDSTATGKIHGEDFVCQRSTLHGGTLNLRQGPRWPPDLGITVYLHAERGEDLAGRSVNIPSDMQNPPRVVVRWKDSQGEAQTKTVKTGYACRVEFDQVKSGHLSGKIYICTTDDERSWVAGAFDAEIRTPER